MGALGVGWVSWLVGVRKGVVVVAGELDDGDGEFRWVRVRML